MVAPANTPMGRSLPHSTEAEEVVISCCAMDGPDVIPKCIMAGIDSPDRFYDPKNGTVFRVMLDLYARQRPTTMDVVAEELKKNRELDMVGGYSFLTQVSSRVSTIAQASFFIEKCRDYALLRALIRSRTASVEDCYGFSGDMEQFMSDLMAKESAVTALGSTQNEDTVSEVATALIAELNLPKGQRTGVANEVSWGLIDLDRGCGRLAPGTLNVLAGMPSTGKSALADMVAWKAACAGKNVVIHSYEMTKREKVIRVAQQESRINFDRVDEVPVDLKIRFTTAVREIQASKRFHIFEMDTTLNRLIARTRLIHQREPVGLIVVDFLQYLARLEPTVGNERSDEKIGRITAALKSLAKECNCPVLLLSSLNREGYKNGLRPNLASLRSSGEIESDADVVMFLHWPKTNPRTGCDQDPHDATQNTFYVECLQEKGRTRGVHQVNLMFDRQATRFDNLGR